MGVDECSTLDCELNLKSKSKSCETIKTPVSTTDLKIDRECLTVFEFKVNEVIRVHFRVHRFFFLVFYFFLSYKNEIDRIENQNNAILCN